MKKQTIQQQIEQLSNTLIEDSYQAFDDQPELREHLNALSQRKLNKQQRAEIEAIKQGLEEWDEAEAEAGGYNMAKHLAEYRKRYQRSVAASGAKSLNNGDDLAAYLEMKTAKEVCELADRFTPIDGQTHWERYERLNEGQRRMNSGNKLRAAIKNGKIEVTENGLREV